jgi:hypothetical protein
LNGSNPNLAMAGFRYVLDMSQGEVGYCHPRASDSMMEG